MRIGVARVSTRDQHQHAELSRTPSASGQLRESLHRQGERRARPPPRARQGPTCRLQGDQFVVTKLDRLGRSPENLIGLSRELQQRSVGLVVRPRGGPRRRPCPAGDDPGVQG
ncbi:recombinase family protein [Streptomyces sp. NPDC056773]|uniref:recombinase family protein n=1 Tax=unclassified Streptomyces TaxID=2593676 RepID=UPI0036CDBF32